MFGENSEIPTLAARPQSHIGRPNPQVVRSGLGRALRWSPWALALRPTAHVP